MSSKKMMHCSRYPKASDLESKENSFLIQRSSSKPFDSVMPKAEIWLLIKFSILLYPMSRARSAMQDRRCRTVVWLWSKVILRFCVVQCQLGMVVQSCLGWAYGLKNFSFTMGYGKWPEQSITCRKLLCWNLTNELRATPEPFRGMDTVLQAYHRHSCVSCL